MAPDGSVTPPGTKVSAANADWQAPACGHVAKEEAVEEVPRTSALSAELRVLPRRQSGSLSSSAEALGLARRSSSIGSTTRGREIVGLGGPRVFRVPKVLWARGDAEIRVVPNFVTDNEITQLLALSDWSESTVRFVKYDEDTGKPMDVQPYKVKPGRTSSSCLLEPEQTTAIAAIEERLANLAGRGLEHLEPLNLVRYQPGQFFAAHHDGGHRSTTIFLYLNDVPQDAGGETHFVKLGLKIRPQKGCAVIWNNLTRDGQRDARLVHQGLPPTGAVKYGMNCFFRVDPVR